MARWVGGDREGRNKAVRNRFRTMSGPAPTLSHGSDATYDRVEYTYDRAAAVVAAKDQGDGNGYAASGVKNKAIPSCQYWLRPRCDSQRRSRNHNYVCCPSLKEPSLSRLVSADFSAGRRFVFGGKDSPSTRCRLR